MHISIEQRTSTDDSVVCRDSRGAYPKLTKRGRDRCERSADCVRACGRAAERFVLRHKAATSLRCSRATVRRAPRRLPRYLPTSCTRSAAGPRRGVHGVYRRPHEDARRRRRRRRRRSRSAAALCRNTHGLTAAAAASMAPRPRPGSAPLPQWARAEGPRRSMSSTLHIHHCTSMRV